MSLKRWALLSLVFACINHKMFLKSYKLRLVLYRMKQVLFHHLVKFLVYFIVLFLRPWC